MKTSSLAAIAVMSLLSLTTVSRAQDTQCDPAGVVTYSLPSTSITLTVHAVKEDFHAGPYAQFATKYLGIEVRKEDQTKVTVCDISIASHTEADPAARYTIDLAVANARPNLLSLTSMGLISMSEGSYKGDNASWRFGGNFNDEFGRSAVSSNVTEEFATLYHRSAEGGSSAFQQTMTVEKTLEKKAAEAAQKILSLRDTRIKIVTGDTDATYSGEAMGAALAEIDRLEKEYLSLFIGYTERQEQTCSYEIVPDASLKSQKYIAFRLSDTNGLSSASDITGKPVLLEITVPSMPVAESGKKAPKGPFIHYRTPAICSVRLQEGTTTLITSRIPIYQLGIETACPVTTKL